MDKKSLYFTIILLVFSLSFIIIQDNLNVNSDSVDSTFINDFDDSKGFFDDTQKIASTEWKTGVSVKTSIASNNHFILEETFRLSATVDLDGNLAQDSYLSNLDLSRTHKNVSYFFARILDDDSDNDTCLTVCFQIDIFGKTGTLEYYYFDDYYNGTDTLVHHLGGTTTITTEHIRGDGRIDLKIISGINDNTFGSYFYLYKNDGTSISIDSETDSLTSDNWDNHQVTFQYFKFIPSTINMEIRSEYNYVTNTTIQHRLFVDNYAYGTTI
ncbi:MAG: hypothetical protein KAS32_07455, partial [Candidatus Peribacteraceae bacterium]|nr:hypothetical protein [Candidatus Peribacteraceae bacterium]